MQNVMPPMIDTELRPRKLSLKKYATPKPRAAAITSLGISTTMPVLIAPGVDLKLMPGTHEEQDRSDDGIGSRRGGGGKEAADLKELQGRKY